MASKSEDASRCCRRRPGRSPMVRRSWCRYRFLRFPIDVAAVCDTPMDRREGGEGDLGLSRGRPWMEERDRVRVLI